MKFHHFYKFWIFYAVMTVRWLDCVCPDEKKKFTLFWLFFISRWCSLFLQFIRTVFKEVPFYFVC